MNKIQIIYFWRDGAYCTEDNFQQEHYKHAQGYLYFECCKTFKDYEIQEYINFYLKNIKNKKNKKDYIKKGFRGSECGVEGCICNYNTFYMNKNTGVYYCRKCSQIINYYANMEICEYVEPDFI